MKQDVLTLWTQRIIKRMLKMCTSPTVLFAMGAQSDAALLRQALPEAEFVFEYGDEGALPAGFDRVLEEKNVNERFGIVWFGEALKALPDDEAAEMFVRLRGRGEFVLLKMPEAEDAETLSHFDGLCAWYADSGMSVYAGVNPVLRTKEDILMANKPRYAVYGIYKNEDKFIGRFLASVKDADEIVLCDTGTTDLTNGMIAEFKRINPGVNLKTFRISIQPWRFDDAWNAALAFVGGDIDICINMGLDETLMENWRGVLDKCWDIRFTRYYHKFQTDWGDGAISQHNHDRPHARRGYVWRLPVHEILEYDGTERVCWNNDFWIYHAPDAGKARGSYLPLLEISAKERPDIWKTWSFLAEEYMAAGRYDEALAAIDKALALLPADKGYLHNLKFFIYRAQNNADLALLHIDSAIAQMPLRREPYVEKARYLFSLNRCGEAYLVIRQAALQADEITDYHHNPDCWGVKFDELTAQLKEAAMGEGAL